MLSTNFRIIPRAIRVMTKPRVTSATIGQLSPIHRELHNRPKHQQVVVSSVAPPQDPHFVPLGSSAFKLNEMKVFQDEQIIQLAFKSGQTVNYTMAWLRNLCSCSECISSKFHCSPTHSGAKQSVSLVDGQLSVARFSTTEEELLIEWLDTEYKSHVSTYNLKYLSLYANKST
ncbi:hypothetical protein TYRP_001805 [Tyrophagus putrescentiae]|nr:hypothetical protein TYRP_001805 [Tyrophagus putrescentiae]